MYIASRFSWLLLPMLLASASPAQTPPSGAAGGAPAPAIEAPSAPTEAAPEVPPRQAIPLGMTPEGLAAKERARQGNTTGTDKTLVSPPGSAVPESAH